MNHRKPFLSILFVALMLALSSIPTQANSALRYWEGTHTSGVIVTDPDCPIIVEDEQLIFDLHEFPLTHYQEEKQFLAYSGKVSAQYTFYNPADYTVNATLVFPFGAAPLYNYESYDEANNRYVHTDDFEKYQLLIDGQPIEKTLRFTYFERNDQFELERDLSLLHDDYVEDEFFALDLPVARYTYEISGIDEEAYPAASAAFDLATDDGKRKYLFMEQSGGMSLENDGLRVSAWADNEQSLTLYVLGEALDQAITWTLYQNGSTENGEEIDGSVTLTDTASLTFKELALIGRDENSLVSDIDWYNAMVYAMNTNCWEHNALILNDPYYDLDISDYLMRWYQYDITLKPHQRIVNTVEAPMYPTIDATIDPEIYEYTYLLSPASSYAQFNTLDIQIHTPYFLLENSLGDFMKNEDGYMLSLTGLPKQELTFSLSASENHQRSTSKTGLLLLGILFAGFIVFMVLIGVVLYLIWRFIKKHQH